MARITIPVDREAAMTFREFARDHCFQMRQWGYASETVDVYDRIYHQFLAYLKSHGATDDLRSFTPRHVHAFAEHLGAATIHPNTIIKALSALRTLAKYGMMRPDATRADRFLLASDPTATFRWPTAQRHETKYLGPDDLRKLVDAEAEPYKVHARDLLIETGIRVGEACRLTVQDFHQVDGRYYLGVRVKGRGQQRKQEVRTVPLSKALGDALHGWLLSRGALDPDTPLLINSEGQPWKRAVLSNMVSRLAVRAGITRLRVSAHKLRHTANVVARLAGIDAATRARMLGHSSLRSLERYDHVLPHELHEAREETLGQLQRYIGKPDRVTADAAGEDRNDAEAKSAPDKENGPA